MKTSTAAKVTIVTALMALSALTCAQATQVSPAHRAKAHSRTCNDKLLCAKIDRLSLTVSKGFGTMGDSFNQQQAANADFQAKSLALSQETVTTLKSIEAQGTQVQHAILLSYDDKPLSVDESAEATATKACTDAGFKSGKPVDVSKHHGLFSSGTQYLKSVVCTY